MKNEKLKGFFSSRMAKGIIVASSALIIGLAVYLNYRWFYDPTGALGFGDNNMDDQNQGAENVGGEVEDENSYFTSTALDRQEARDEANANVPNKYLNSSPHLARCGVFLCLRWRR